jgi:hypothetical protein
VIEALVRRWLPIAAVGLLLAGLVRAQRAPGFGADLYLHLRVGAEFLDGWSISQPGHFGPYDSQAWYPTQWLTQIGMASAEQWGGLSGVMWLTGTVICVLAVTVYVGCRTVAAPLPAALAAIVAIMAATPGLSGRPQVLSYILISIVMTAWLATARDGRARWWLVVVNWVWVPLHGMWMIGILIGVVATIGIALERQHDRRHVLKLALIPVLSALVTVFTPLGVHVLESVAVVGDRAQFLDEWDPPDFTTAPAAILALMIAVVMMAALRRDPVDWPTIMLFGLAIAWSIYTLRTTVVGAVMLAPLLADTLQRFVPRGPSIRRAEAAALAAMLVGASCALVLVSNARADDKGAPAWLDERLEAMPAGTAVLNEFNEGAYSSGATHSWTSSCTGTPTRSATKRWTETSRSASWPPAGTARSLSSTSMSPSSTPSRPSATP